jgi:tetratricopeptide (TPR) repeat protein
VVVLVAVVAAAAVVLGVWATVAGRSGVFGRLTGLVGVCLLLLVVVLAAVGMLVWAQQPLDAQYPVDTQHPLDTRRPAPDMVMVPMPMPVGSGPDTGSFPVLVMDDLPRQPPEPAPPPDPMAELAEVLAAEPGGVRAGVLELMSVLSAAGVRRDLILAAGQAGLLGAEPEAEPEAEMDVDAVAGALGQLAGRSLLSFSPDGRVVSADRPVLRAVRAHLAEQERLAAACRVAVSVLEARCEALAGSPNRRAVLDVPDQVRALRDVVAGLPGEPDPELAGALLRLRGWTLYLLNALGDQTGRAIATGEPLVADQERVLGPDDPHTLAAQNNLANAYRAAGRTDDAVALHERVLAARERVLGPDHPHAVQSRQNLAAACRAAGRAGEAAAYEPKTPAPEAAAPPEQPPAGQGAVALYEQVLADRERELGPDHPDTLNSRKLVAAAYQAAGRTDEAIALYQQVLADRERVLGPDHPDTLATSDSLAAACRAAGRPPE